MNQSVVVVSGSLQPFRRGFEDRLVELGYRPSSVLRRLVVVAQFSRWLATEGVEPEELSACGMDAFVAQVASTSRYRRRTARRALRDLLGYLVELGVVRAGEAPVLDDPNEVLLRQFADHLVHERGVARHTTTVRDYQRKRHCRRRQARMLWLCRVRALSPSMSTKALNRSGYCQGQSTGAARQPSHYAPIGRIRTDIEARNHMAQRLS